MATRSKGAATAAPAPSRSRSRKVRIRILPSRQVAGIGVAGDEANVSKAEADTLIAEGYAEPASNPKPKREPEPEPTYEIAPRRPLTPRAIEEGTEQRGG